MMEFSNRYIFPFLAMIIQPNHELMCSVVYVLDLKAYELWVFLFHVCCDWSSGIGLLDPIG